MRRFLFRGGFLLGLLLLFVGTVGLYQRSWSYPLVRDDEVHLSSEDRWLRPLSELTQTFAEPFWDNHPEGGLFRPWTAFTIQATTSTAGLEPAPLRITNLGLHLIVILLWVVLLRRLQLSPGAALAFAALTLPHPLLSEAVLEVVSRSESQAQLFSLLAILLILSKSTALGVGAGACWFLALCSKESAVGALPALLWAVLRNSEGKPASRRWVPLIGLAAALLAYLALRGNALGGVLGLDPGNVSPLDNPLVAATVWSRVATALSLVSHYVRLLVWPGPLSADYSLAALPVTSFADPAAWLGLAIVLLVSGALVILWHKNCCQIGIPLLFAAGIFLPVSNLLVPVGTIFAERLFYGPALGCVAALVGLLDLRRGRVPFAAYGLVVLVIAGLLGARLSQRIGDWKSSEHLYRAALEVVPESARVQCTVGAIDLKQGRKQSAEIHFRRALELFPGYLKAHSHLALLLFEGGDGQGAMQHWKQAATHPKSHPDDIVNYCQAVLRYDPTPDGLQEAIDLLKALCRRVPGHGDYLRLLQALQQRHRQAAE